MLTVLVAVLLTTAPAAPAPAAGKKEAKAEDVIRRGEPLSGKSPRVAFADVAKNPGAYAGKTVTIDGAVRKACSKKGCWMELAEAPDAKSPGARVTFKDYGFFVPTDSKGSKATVEGVVELTTLSEADAKHLEAEGAQIPRDAEGKPSEVRIVASGVELRR
ncbi:MAG: DUF4920 domain-containing protein [Myxococcales bacterium]